MKAITILMAALFLPGCAIETTRYYLPTDIAIAREGTTCGFAYYGTADVELLDGANMSISVSPKNEQINTSLQLNVPSDVRVRFLDPAIEYETDVPKIRYKSVLKPWTLSVYGRNGRPGHIEHFEPGSMLEGQGRNAILADEKTQYMKRDLFISSASVAAPPANKLVMRVPPIEVNGKLVEPKAISLHLVEKKSFLTCIQ